MSKRFGRNQKRAMREQHAAQMDDRMTSVQLHHQLRQTAEAELGEAKAILAPHVQLFMPDFDLGTLDPMAAAAIAPLVKAHALDMTSLPDMCRQLVAKLQSLHPAAPTTGE